MFVFELALPQKDSIGYKHKNDNFLMVYDPNDIAIRALWVKTWHPRTDGPKREYDLACYTADLIPIFTINYAPQCNIKTKRCLGSVYVKKGKKALNQGSDEEQIAAIEVSGAVIANADTAKFLNAIGEISSFERVFAKILLAPQLSEGLDENDLSQTHAGLDPVPDVTDLPGSTETQTTTEVLAPFREYVASRHHDRTAAVSSSETPDSVGEVLEELYAPAFAVYRPVVQRLDPAVQDIQNLNTTSAPGRKYSAVPPTDYPLVPVSLFTDLSANNVVPSLSACGIYLEK